MSNDDFSKLRRSLPAAGMVEDAIVLSKAYQFDYIEFSKEVDGFNVTVKLVPSEDQDQQDDT